MIRDYSKKMSVYDYIRLGGHKCWYCGVELTRYTWTSDHFWPKSKGGRLRVNCCSKCNILKSNLMPMEWINLIGILRRSQSERATPQKKFDRMIRATDTLWKKVKWSVKDNAHKLYIINIFGRSIHVHIYKTKK